MMQESIDPNWIGTGSEEDEIYKENILDHYKNPRNFGRIESCQLKHREFNPVCGDDITLFVKFEGNLVKEVKFCGNGCAISIAAASMLSEKIKGMDLNKLSSITEEDILEMIGIKLGVVRIKCGILCLKTLFNGIKKIEAGNEQTKN